MVQGFPGRISIAPNQQKIFSAASSLLTEWVSSRDWRLTDFSKPRSPSSQHSSIDSLVLTELVLQLIGLLKIIISGNQILGFQSMKFRSLKDQKQLLLIPLLGEKAVRQPIVSLFLLRQQNCKIQVFLKIIKSSMLATHSIRKLLAAVCSFFFFFYLTLSLPQGFFDDYQESHKKSCLHELFSPIKLNEIDFLQPIQDAGCAERFQLRNQPRNFLFATFKKKNISKQANQTLPKAYCKS